jgi:endoglucanase
LTKLHGIVSYLLVYGSLVGGVANATAVQAIPSKMQMSNPGLELKGINLSGGEYSANTVTAQYGYKYMYPSNSEIDYYKSKGFTTIRLPFSGSRLQPVNGGALNAAELGRIRAVVDYAGTKGMYVVLDPHEYGARYDAASKTKKFYGVKGGLPASQFGNFWKRVALEFKTYPNVIYGLMNEPHIQTPKEWRAVAEYGIYGIRKAQAKQLILISGTSWTGAHSWVSSGNAAAWAGYKGDPNFAFEVHQYLDSDSSGNHATCVANKGTKVLDAVSSWARTNRVKLFMGEMGWSQDPKCLVEGAAMMQAMTRSPDVWTGWTYWSGGPWVKQDYMYMLTPSSLKQPVDRLQMKALTSSL